MTDAVLVTQSGGGGAQFDAGREAHVPPPRTAMEAFKSLPEGTLAEVIDNALYITSSPSEDYQDISLALSAELYLFLKQTGKGRAFAAPMDVYLDEENNAVQPDLIVVLKENEGIIRPRGHIHGVPDLLVEILSSDQAYDLVKKKELYARYGVKEYFVVEPQSRLVMHFTLTGGASYTMNRQEIGVLHSGLLGADLRF